MSFELKNKNKTGTECVRLCFNSVRRAYEHAYTRTQIHASAYTPNTYAHKYTYAKHTQSHIHSKTFNTQTHTNAQPRRWHQEANTHASVFLRLRNLCPESLGCPTRWPTPSLLFHYHYYYVLNYPYYHDIKLLSSYYSYLITYSQRTLRAPQETSAQRQKWRGRSRAHFASLLVAANLFFSFLIIFFFY